MIGLQLVAWSMGGIYFAWNDLAVVRGDVLRRERPAVDLRGVRAPAVADAKGARVIARLGAAAWDVERADGTRLVLDAATGEELAPLSLDEALAVVTSAVDVSFSAPVATLLEADPPIEYREKPLPAWRVTLDDARHTNVYVDARSGEVTAIRNDAWRRWDFLWALHIMDWRGREEMHHPLLLGSAALAFCAAASGLGLWAWRLFARVAKRRRGAA